jgi:hypothetical protein
MGVVIALAVAAIVVVSKAAPQATATASLSSSGTKASSSIRPRPPGLTGLLLYTAPDSPTTSRIWIWDLQGGTVTPGPLVPTPLQLVDAYRTLPGWVGVTAQTGGGTQAAVLVREWGAQDHPRTLLRGDRVAWAPGGYEVSSATVTGDGPCGTLEVRSYVPQFSEGRTRLRTPVCGQLNAMTQGLGFPYLGVVGGGDATIYLAGSASLAPILPHYLLLGSSPNDDFLVESYSCVGPGPGPTNALCPGLSLFYSSLSDEVPVPYSQPGGVLLPERVLGWTGDGRTAYVLGTYLHGDGEIRGFYRVRTGPRPLPLAPTLVWPSDAGGEQITFTDAGVPILKRGGVLAAILHGKPVVLNRPGGPSPDGPILWVRSLPYSPV